MNSPRRTCRRGQKFREIFSSLLMWFFFGRSARPRLASWPWCRTNNKLSPLWVALRSSMWRSRAAFPLCPGLLLEWENVAFKKFPCLLSSFDYFFLLFSFSPHPSSFHLLCRLFVQIRLGIKRPQALLTTNNRRSTSEVDNIFFSLLKIFFQKNSRQFFHSSSHRIPDTWHQLHFTSSSSFGPAERVCCRRRSVVVGGIPEKFLPLFSFSFACSFFSLLFNMNTFRWNMCAGANKSKRSRRLCVSTLPLRC